MRPFPAVTPVCAALLSVFSAAAQAGTFPIWGEEAQARGYELPRTYGLTLSAMDIDQPLVIDEIRLTDPNMILDQLVAVEADKADQESQTYTLRADMWVFPFLNLYGLVGYTEGTSEAMVVPFVAGNPVTAEPVLFPLDFNGTTYGGGLTLAYGIGNWWAAIDINYTFTDLNIIDGEIEAFTSSPRLGYRWPMGVHEYRLWAGAMYQDVDQVFRGQLASLGLGGGLGELLQGIAPDGRFEVRQHLVSPWNTLVGAMYVYDRRWEFILEGGFGDRDSIFFSTGYRF
ncbi:hypothetical protein KUV89_18735 [Marinobacter hydrocarbonoclasticus]|nr:hypothetical protein [Marinobacter nauticus]